MATHSSTQAWKIPWTGEPGGLPSIGLHRVRHYWSDLAAGAVVLQCCVSFLLYSSQSASCIHIPHSFTFIQLITYISSIQFSFSVMSNSVTSWTAAHQVSLSITNSQSLLKLMSIKLVMPSNHLILCRPLLLLPSVFTSIRVFSNESVLWIQWPKYWSFSFSISPSNEHPGLISFRID